MISSVKEFVNRLRSLTFLKNMIKYISSKFNYTIYVRINNRKFKVPILNNLGFSNITLSDGLWVTDLFSKLLGIKKGDFIDIGANVGQTLLQFRSVNNEVNYYGFEPNPSCAYYIRNLIKRNSLAGSYIVAAGIYTKNTIIKFDVMSEADPGGSLVEDLRPGYNYNEKLLVPVYNFDSIAESLGFTNIALIKIDVEGAELDVLMSLRESINKFRPYIICEILWAHNEDKLDYCDSRNNAIIKFAKESKYGIYRIIKKSDQNSVDLITKINQIDKIVYSEENRELCDYLFVPEEERTLVSTILKIEETL